MKYSTQLFNNKTENKEFNKYQFMIFSEIKSK